MVFVNNVDKEIDCSSCQVEEDEDQDELEEVLCIGKQFGYGIDNRIY